MVELERTVKYIGSYPAETTEEAMRDQIEYGGHNVLEVSDGETGSRQNWIVDHINSYRDSEAFTVTKEGGWSSYEDCPEFDVAPGRTLKPADFQLRYHADAVAAWPTLARLREEYDRPDIKLQVGVPHYLDMSLFTFGLQRGLDPELLDTYAQATSEQIERIRNEDFGNEVVFQIETPASMSMALFPQDQLPNSLLPEALGDSIADLANRSPEGSHFGVHLCLGDLGNESRGQLPDRTAAVALMNTIADHDVWRGKQHLDYIHEPVAAGKNPPILDQQTYQALRDLRLPQETRYIAGMVHEDQTFEEQSQVLAWIQGELPEGQALGLAAACGLGRRTQRMAAYIAMRTTALARL